MIVLSTMTPYNEAAEPAITEPSLKQTVNMMSISRKSNISAKLRTSGIIPAMPMQYPNVIQLNNMMWPYVPYIDVWLLAVLLMSWPVGGGGRRTAVSYELEIKA